MTRRLNLSLKTLVCTENSILPEISWIRAEGVASENLICPIQNRPAVRSELSTPHESGPFSAESSFRYTQGPGTT